MANKQKTRVVLPGGIQGLVHTLQNGTAEPAMKAQVDVTKLNDENDDNSYTSENENNEVAAEQTVQQAPQTQTQQAAPVHPTQQAPQAQVQQAAPAQPDKFALADMVREKFAKKDVTKVNEKIAIEIKAYGDKEYYIYILIDDGKVTVEPWGYIDNDVHIDMPIDDVVAVVNGKYDFVAKALSGDFYAIGSVTKLLKAYEALIK